MSESELLELEASTIEQAKAKVRDIFDRKSTIALESITKEQYDEQQSSEREHSDNHMQQERLGQESSVIPMIYRKYTVGAERNEYYRIVLKHEDGSSQEDYFMIVPDLE